MWGDGDQIVVVDGVRVRRDEAGALGITIPGASAPAPETVADEDTEPAKPARGKSRTPANKQRRNVQDK